MWSVFQKKYWLSANSAFCLVVLSTGLFVLLIDAQLKQQTKIPINSQLNIFAR